MDLKKGQKCPKCGHQEFKVFSDAPVLQTYDSIKDDWSTSEFLDGDTTREVFCLACDVPLFSDYQAPLTEEQVERLTDDVLDACGDPKYLRNVVEHYVKTNLTPDDYEE